MGHAFQSLCDEILHQWEIPRGGLKQRAQIAPVNREGQITPMPLFKETGRP